MTPEESQLSPRLRAMSLEESWLSLRLMALSLGESRHSLVVTKDELECLKGYETGGSFQEVLRMIPHHPTENSKTEEKTLEHLWCQDFFFSHWISKSFWIKQRKSKRQQKMNDDFHTDYAKDLKVRSLFEVAWFLWINVAFCVWEFCFLFTPIRQFSTAISLLFASLSFFYHRKSRQRTVVSNIF